MIILTFIPFLFLLAVIFFCIGIFVMKKNGNGENEKGGEQVIKVVYNYLIMFITLMMVIGGSIGIFMSISDYVSPNTYGQTFEEYKRYEKEIFDNGKDKKVVLSEEELRDNYDAMVREQKEDAQQDALRTLIQMTGFIVIPGPIFLYFHRRNNKIAEAS